MKVAVSASGPDLGAQVDPRFGRCQYFIIVDTATMDFEAIPNVSAGAMSGAGIQAAQMVVEKGVQAVITGNVGPNAFQVLSSAGIRILVGASGTVRSAVEAFKVGGLVEAQVPGPGHSGMGVGWGMGRGMGRGMSASQFPPYFQTPIGPSMPISPSRGSKRSLCWNLR
ncbi:MAG: NifB/NifX family molybdenum-iron cluster-binding protein [Candidatus Brockarchaeota archaeon]|nr:NifB/NifX family molybdenum-iron cluster-binding protein [Candidatus Brockarchaeota archaeon]